MILSTYRIELLPPLGPLLRQQTPLDLVSRASAGLRGTRFCPPCSLGHTLGEEQAPLGSILLVVEGGLRIVGTDSSGTDFTLRRFLRSMVGYLV